MKMTKKAALVAVLCVALVGAMTVAGTLAYLTDRNSAANDFTWGDVGLSIKETDTGLDKDEKPQTNSYEITPGASVLKDPIVTLEASSAECWLYVRLEESVGFDSVLSYSVAEGWQLLEDSGTVSIWYRTAEPASKDRDFQVISENKLTVTANEDALRALSAEPTLSVSAYAVQTEGVDSAEEGWQLVGA